MTVRDALEVRKELAREQDRLATLDRERARTHDRVEALRAELEADRSQTVPLRRDAAARNPEEKVALFRSLFRGRTDVFARYWTNQRTGTTGYAPACDNEWLRGVCEKPRVKCGDCRHQAFAELSGEVILDHLRGRHVVGLYPLLEDDSCWLIAADFDEGTWQADAGAFAATCRALNVPVAIERSRSGRGAHVWCFFDAPVPAVLARQMACHLLTETMERRHELSMKSYDRLFPNQDTMPRGGFGNLIALPLQYEARERGNSVFIDDEGEPYPDQWEYLESLPRMAAGAVQFLAQEAARRGRVVGVPLVHDEADGPRGNPWQRALPTPSSRLLPSEPLPARINATLAGRLFIEKAGLSPAVLSALKRTAAFQNPEFFKKQSMRLSTALTPRVISCAEDHPHHVALPRGCVEPTRTLFEERGSNLEIRDERVAGEPLEVSLRLELTDVQRTSMSSLAAHDTGILVAPPGAGKTVIAAGLIASRARNALVLVHRTQLVEQWVARLAMCFGVDPKRIGQIGAGRRNPNGQIDVAMIQSLVRKDRVDDLVDRYGQVVVDECHHVPAVSFERVMREVRARYIIGLTATPQRRDGHHPIAHFQLGPVRFTVDSHGASKRRLVVQRLIVRETQLEVADAGELGIQEIYQRIAADRQRNDLILDDIISALAAGRSPIVLTERRDHLEFLVERLRPFARNLVTLSGGMGQRDRRAANEQLAAIPDNAERLILATGRFVGEGFDDARLDTLFLTMPLSWRGTLIQYAGRLNRHHRKKLEVQIYDYVDRKVTVLARMFARRMRGYQALGYATDAPTPESPAAR